MNTRLAKSFLKDIRGGDYHIYPEHVRNIPIPPATPAQQKPIITLVDRILAAKKKDPEADTSKLEGEIDQLVYKLYGLTEDEIAVVEGKERKTKGKGEGSGMRNSRRVEVAKPEREVVEAVEESEEYEVLD